MIVDPKIQNMLENCRQRKMKIDKNIKSLRAVIFTPPAIIMAYALINSVMHVVSGALLAVMGGIMSGAEVGPFSIIISIAMTVFAAGEALLQEKKLIDISGWFFPAAAGLCVIVTVLFPAEAGMMLMFAAYSIIMIPVNIAFKKELAKDEEMKPLKGYPHFNVLYLSDKDFKKETEDPEERQKRIDEMTDDERLMYERDNNM